MTDEIRLSSYPWRSAAGAGLDMSLVPGSDGADEEAHGAAGRGFEIFAILQALADQERMAEADRGAHELLGDLARVDGLELARRHAVAQDHLDDRAHGFLMGADRGPRVLHRHQDDVVHARLGEEILLVVP